VGVVVEVEATVDVISVGLMVEIVLAVLVIAAVAVSAALVAATSVAVDVTSNAVVTVALVMVSGVASLEILAGMDDGDDEMRFQLLVSSFDSSIVTESMSDDVSDTILVVAISAVVGYVLFRALAGLAEVLMVVEAALASGVK